MHDASEYADGLAHQASQNLHPYANAGYYDANSVGARTADIGFSIWSLFLGVGEVNLVSKSGLAAEKVGVSYDAAMGVAERGLGSGKIELLPGGTGDAFAGHGLEAGFEGSFGKTVVPEGTSLMLPGTTGIKVSDGLGRAIESGDWDAIMNNSQWMQRMEGSTTYLPGATVPNLLLTPGGGLKMFQNSMRVDTPTLLDSLLGPNMGHLNWAACRECL